MVVPSRPAGCGATFLRAAAGRLIARTAAGKKPPQEAVFSLAAAVCAALLGLSGDAEAGAPSHAAAFSATEAPRAKLADFGRQTAPSAVRKFGNWIVESGDHSGLPFAIVDKAGAKLYLFKPVSKLRGARAAGRGAGRRFNARLQCQALASAS